MWSFREVYTSTCTYMYISLTCLAVCLTVTPIKAEMCQASDPVPIPMSGKHGQSISLEGEDVKNPYYFARWMKTVYNPKTQETTEKNLVSHDQSGETWHDPSLQQRMSATFVEDGNKMKYTLQITKLTCGDSRVYRCRFSRTGALGDCDVRFNVSITADPLPPSIKDKGIAVNVEEGSTITVHCEANVGKPAGDIWWYYIPQGSDVPDHRITAGVQSNETSAEDCRRYIHSYLTVQGNKEQHGAKYRCVTKKYGGVQMPDYDQVQVSIKGVEPMTTPEIPCQGTDCSVIDGTGGAATLAIALSTITAHVLLFVITMCVL